MNFITGKWVVFTHDLFVRTDNIIVKGMIGQLVGDPWGITRTGLDAMVLPIGAKEPYGHLEVIMKVLEKDPTPQEIEESKKMWQNAFELYVQNNGWCGFVKIGKNIMDQERALRELKDQCQKLLSFTDISGREKDAMGTKKRIATVLKSFAQHPLGDNALLLQECIVKSSCNKSELIPIIYEINIWIEKALSIDHPDTSSESLNKAWQGKNISVEFIPFTREFFPNLNI